MIMIVIIIIITNNNDNNAIILVWGLHHAMLMVVERITPGRYQSTIWDIGESDSSPSQARQAPAYCPSVLVLLYNFLKH